MTENLRPSVREAAETYRNLGIVPIPVKHGSKRPAVSGWQNLTLDADLDEMFPADEHLNIGVLLGTPSGDLVDIDCDCPEAILAADKAIGEASVRSRRGDAEASHYWFRISDGAPPATQRFEDPASPGAVLVELRSTGGQTVVPPSRHPDGTPYLWMKELTEGAIVDNTSRSEVERITRTIASIAALARYWPGPGSRHHANLALCGALLRHPDTGEVNEVWRTQAAGFARTVGTIGKDTEWRDREQNVDTTIDALEKGENVRSWTALTEYIPASVVWQVREWLGLTPTEKKEEPKEDDDLTEWDEDTKTLDEEWRRMYIGKAITEGVEEPQELIPGTGLLYKGEVTTIQSAGGSGKTLIAMNLLWRAVQNGLKVVFVDEENGPNEVARRFMTFGVDPELLDKHLIYYAMPSINWFDASNPDRLIDMCQEEKVDLVLVDSVMDMMSSSGLDENDNSEFNDLYNRTIKRLKNDNRAVLLLDHVSKDSSWMARGASAKFDQSSVVWGVKVNDKFDAHNSGSVTLKRRKGRMSVVVNEVLVTITVDGEGSTSIAYYPDVKITTGEDDEVSLHDEVVKALMHLDAAGQDKAVSKKAVRDAVPKDDHAVNEYLDEPQWPVRSRKVHARLFEVWLDEKESDDE